MFFGSSTGVRPLIVWAVLASVFAGIMAFDGGHAQTQPPEFQLGIELDHRLAAGGHVEDETLCVGAHWEIEDTDLVWVETANTRSSCVTKKPLVWPKTADAATIAFEWAATQPDDDGVDCVPRATGAAYESTVWLHLKLRDKETGTVFADHKIYEGSSQTRATETLLLPRGAMPRSDVDVEWHAWDSEVDQAPTAPTSCAVPYLRVTPQNITYHLLEDLSTTTSGFLSDLRDGTGGYLVDVPLRLTRPVVDQTISSKAWLNVPDGRYRLDSLTDDAGTRVPTATSAALSDVGWRMELPAEATQAILAGPVRLEVLDTTTAPAATTHANLVWPAVLLAILDGWLLPTAIAYSLRFAHRAGAAEKRPVLVYASLTAAAALGGLVALVPLILGGGLALLARGAATLVDLAALGLAIVSLAVAGGTILHMQSYGIPALAERERLQAAERAASANRAEELELFVSGLGHDLKTPLLALDWLTQDVEAELQSGDPDLIKESFSRIRANVGGMDRLVHDLLDMTRVDRGEYDEVAVDVREVVDDALATLEPLRSKQGTNVHVDRRSLPMVLGDHALYRQIFQNLVGNAIKYGRTPDGNVYVRALRAAEDELRFEVEDDGQGIPEDEQSSVFDMFRRGTTGDGHEGTGLGLTLVRKVVEKYHGRIWVETPDEGGSRFVISLPAKRLVPRKGSPAPEEGGHQETSLNVPAAPGPAPTRDPTA